MQNTIVRGGMAAGKKINGERKAKENYMKNWVKVVKIALWFILAGNLIRRGKKFISKEGEGGGMIEMHNIYPWYIANCMGFLSVE